MPVNNTKYNYVNKLQFDLSNNSYINPSSRHILTCDPSDVYLNDETTDPYKVYLGSKASHLIHPFSKVSNCQKSIGELTGNQLVYNNSNSLFTIKIPSRCSDSSYCSQANAIQRQKQMQNVVRAPSSLYTMNLSSLHVNSNDISGSDVARGKYNASDRLTPHGKGKNIGVDIKHNSYDRYLARKKSQYLKTEQSNKFVPKYGNKTMKFGLVYGSRCKNC
tara:strand:- start:4497 stop:5153 length:657 start_codon:yes stop_codon:yes gene_type:complete